MSSWPSAILYSVVTDRFAVPTPPRGRGPFARHGGSLTRLQARLPYIAGLGFTGLLISPVYANEPGGYHGYWPVDFEAVDPALGTTDDLAALGRAARAQGLDLILDIVANHTAPSHPWTSDPSRENWFHHHGRIRNWDDPAEVENGDLSGLPDLAQEVPEVARFLTENAAAWVRLAGASGIRIDAAKHMPKWFLARLARRVEAERPGALVLGEVAHESRAFIETYGAASPEAGAAAGPGATDPGAAGLGALLDFPLCSALREGLRQDGDLRVLANEIDGRDAGSGVLWATFIDNHDMPRFRHIAGAGPAGLARLRLALAALLTLPGLPIIYYGTECGMEGGPDPDCRRDMAWGANPDLASQVEAFIRLRRSRGVFAGGKVTVLEAGRDFIAYRLDNPEAGRAGAAGAGAGARSDPAAQAGAAGRAGAATVGPGSALVALNAGPGVVRLGPRLSLGPWGVMIG